MHTPLQKLNIQIARMQERADALRQNERTKVIAQVVKTMRHWSISVEDLIAMQAVKQAPAKKGAKAEQINPRWIAPKPKRKLAPKYRNPQTGDTWTGRGRSPVWLTTLEGTGRSRDEFLVEPAMVFGEAAGKYQEAKPAIDERQLGFELRRLSESAASVDADRSSTT